MTQTHSIHFDTDYDVTVLKIKMNGHVSVTVYGHDSGDLTLFFPGEDAAMTFLAKLRNALTLLPNLSTRLQEEEYEVVNE